MKQMKRRIFVWCMIAALLCTALPMAAHAAEPAVRLLSIYGSDMLFQQKAPVQLAGYAPGGSKLLAELYQGKTRIAYVKGEANRSGEFLLTLPGQPGSYIQYSILLYHDEQLVAELDRIVFGELWLAGGQSNMAWQYGITPEGFAAHKAGEVPDQPYVRILKTPAFPEYNGSGDNLPLLPQNDIPGAHWVRGDTTEAYGFSATGWFFACDLQAELDMPIGMIEASLGGSSIYTWLAREEIDAQLKPDVEALWRYLPAEGWETHSDPNPYQDMTANFNKRIYALRQFSPAGVLWYQGETDVIGYISRGVPWEGGAAYKRALLRLRNSWAELFNQPDLSLVTTNLAGYAYYPEKYPAQPGLFNALLGEIAAAEPNITTVAIYDVPLNWDIAREVDASLDYMGAIHPYIKKPIGERLALAAMELRYGGDVATPLLKSAEIKDGAIVLTFENTGDGLMIHDETRLRGFTIAAADGYYHEAQAKIIAPNQLRVWNEGIAEPASAAYAVGLFSANANLFAAFPDGTNMPAAPFVTQQLPDARYLRDIDWRSCDFAQVWQIKNDPLQVPPFAALGRNTQLRFIAEGGVQGGFVQIERPKGSVLSFGITPEDAKGDYSREKSVSFYVRNTGSAAVKLTGLRFYTSAISWYSPAACIEIPAGSGWQKITLNLEEVYLYGKAFVPRLPGDALLLQDVTKLELRFDAAPGAACSVDVDEFSFTPRQTEDGFGYATGQIFRALLHPLRTVWALFMTLV